MAEKILELKNLSYKTGGKQILQGLDLQIDSNQIVGLLGANGAGKTTLMRIITGVAKNYKGTVNVLGQENETFRKENISYNAQLVPDFSLGTKGSEVLRFYTSVYPDFNSDKFLTISEYLDVKLDNKLGKMSKGEIARLSMALVFSRTVPLYLLDEPFEGIDSMTRKRITDTIIKWKEPDATVIFSDHYLNDISNLLDDIVIIKDSEIIEHLPAEQIRSQYGQTIEEFYESKY